MNEAPNNDPFCVPAGQDALPYWIKRAQLLEAKLAELERAASVITNFDRVSNYYRTHSDWKHLRGSIRGARQLLGKALPWSPK